MKIISLFFGLTVSAFATAAVPLFNGHDLSGWVQRGGEATYHVDGGEIVGTSRLHTPNSFLCTERDYSDFILEYEFKVDPRLNSGVQLRSEYFDTPTTFDWRGESIAIAAGRVHGYQVEIDPSGRAWSGGIFDEGRRKWMYPEFAGGEGKSFTATGASVFKSNAWNHVRVEAQGSSLKTWLNGVPRADIVDDVTPRGFIALQVHTILDDVSKAGTQVRWRNLQITELDPPTVAERPLNILVLFADDWRHDSLGVAGNPIVQTPRLDQLAHDGVRFTRACVTTAICGVSRATLLTGQWMSRHGNRAFSAFKTPWAETYPGLLRDHGYYVGHVGKWHNGEFPAENFDFGRSYSGTHWIDEPDGSCVHVTQKNENDALEFLRTRPTDQPFCLTVAFFATHAEDDNPLQFLPQPQSMSLYRDVTIPVPVSATELERQGVLDNTLVIFTTDNGYYHAEHGLADKWYPHEESIRVPLIVVDPRMDAARRGTTNDDFALNVDLAPTLLAAAGIVPPTGMQGTDLSPLYLTPSSSPWRQEFFYEHPTYRSTDFIPASQALVRHDWKYLYWPDFDREQLFDLRHDPHEENDLINDPNQADRLAEMRRQFSTLRSAAL